MDLFPPPHTVWFEPLEERATRNLWSGYCQKHAKELDFQEVDAAEIYSVEDFSKYFENWITTKSSKRIRILMIWHAHFLSLACQQVLRRWMEVKSYRSRIWFHVELLNTVQSAILSRCILKRVNGTINAIENVTVTGDRKEFVAIWKKRIQESLANK